MWRLEPGMPLIHRAIGHFPQPHFHAVIRLPGDFVLPRLDALHVDCHGRAGHDAEFRPTAGQTRRISARHHGLGRDAACIYTCPAKQAALNDRDLNPCGCKALGQGRASLSGTDNNGLVRDAHGLIPRTWGAFSIIILWNPTGCLTELPTLGFSLGEQVPKSLWIAAVLLGVVCSAVVCTAQDRQLVDRYCVTCHNQRLKTAGLFLDTMDPANVPADAEAWEKVVRKLRTGAMPPPGMPRPDGKAVQGFASAIETRLDSSAQAKPYAGRPLLHRLNRAEYANAIRDLLALDVDTTALLPPDDSAYGFDNISDVLNFSPSLQERYLSAAASISALAIGDPNVKAASATYRVRQDLSQNQHIEGLPLGTVGGVLVRYNFPLDGEYEFQAKLYRTNLNIMRGLEFAHQVEFTVGGQRILMANIGGTADLASLFEKPTETGDAVDARLRVRVVAKAGPSDVSVAFLEGPEVQRPERLQPFQRSSTDNFDWSGWPHIQTLSITGPFNPTGPGDTPSRRRIFACRPDQTIVKTIGEAACARKILAALARKAYRQPISDADLARILSFFETGRRDGGFESGIELALERILASPKFVLRVEKDAANAAAGSVYRVGDLDLASRLSFFLWSSIPDDELLTLAAA